MAHLKRGRDIPQPCNSPDVEFEFALCLALPLGCRLVEQLELVLRENGSGVGPWLLAAGYIAQLIDLGDPELENFASFAKLLANRLDGIPPENVDLRGIALSGFDIKVRPEIGKGEKGHDDPFKPFGPGESPSPGIVPVYIQDLFEKLNSLFGQAAPLTDQAAFVNQIAAIAQGNQVVMAQVDKSPQDQAMKGNLPGAVEAAIARAMTSHASLATLLLKSDKQALGIFTSLIYDMQKKTARRSMSVILRVPNPAAYRPLSTLHDHRCRWPCKNRFRLAGCAFAKREPSRSREEFLRSNRFYRIHD